MYQAKNKFVAFIDILGFSAHVEDRKAEGKFYEDLIHAARELGKPEDKKAIDEYGPSLCPSAKRVAANIDFELTQVSDCAIVSAEFSPAGAIAVIGHCQKATFALMRTGLMVGGYICSGPMYHDGLTIVGSAYQRSAKGEGKVQVSGVSK